MMIEERLLVFVSASTRFHARDLLSKKMSERSDDKREARLQDVPAYGE